MPTFRRLRTVRRPRNWWAPSGAGVRSRVQTFIDANGGDSKFLGWGDYRVNVTDDGTGKASQWDDVRGAGAGHLVALTQGTQANRPAITAGGVVFTASSSEHMMSALDSRLTMNQAGAQHLVLICQSPSGSAFLMGISQDPTLTTSKPYQCVATNASKYQSQFNPASVDVDVANDLGTAFDATTRAIICGRDQTHGSLSAGDGDYLFRMGVLGRMYRYQAGVNQPNATASGMKLCLGRWGSTYADMTVLAFFVCTVDWSTTWETNLRTFLQSEYGVTLDTSARNAPHWAGTSTDRGHNSTHPKGWKSGEDATTTAQHLCAAASSGPGLWSSFGLDIDDWAMSEATNGNLLSDQVGVYSERFQVETVGGRTGPLIYVIGGLLGEILTTYAGAGGDTSYETAISNFIATLHADGIKVLLRTVMDYSQFYTAGVVNQIGLNMIAVNQWIRTTAQGLAGVVGWMEFEHQAGSLGEINRASPVNGHQFAYQDTLYFDGTGHPTDAMQALMGAIERAEFDGNAGILGLPITYSHVGSGGLSLAGAAAIDLTKSVIPSGGLTIAGAATADALKRVTAAGGLAIGGQTTIDVVKNVVAAGGLSIAGQGIVDVVKRVIPSGGLAIGGAAASHVTITPHPSGGLTIGGTAPVTFKGQYIVTGSGGLAIGGAAAASLAKAALMSGGLALSGHAPTAIRYSAVPTGGLRLGGQAVYRVTFVPAPAGGLRLAGSAVSVFVSGLATAGAFDGLIIFTPALDATALVSPELDGAVRLQPD